jgi:hypothetical protein
MGWLGVLYQWVCESASGASIHWHYAALVKHRRPGCGSSYPEDAPLDRLLRLTPTETSSGDRGRGCLTLPGTNPG